MMNTYWHPIDTAPKDGTRILLWDGLQIKVGQWRDTSYFEEEPIRETKSGKCIYELVKRPNGYWDIDDYELCPRLWMHLPDSPKAET